MDLERLKSEQEFISDVISDIEMRLSACQDEIALLKKKLGIFLDLSDSLRYIGYRLDDLRVKYGPDNTVLILITLKNVEVDIDEDKPRYNML